MKWLLDMAYTPHRRKRLSDECGGKKRKGKTGWKLAGERKTPLGGELRPRGRGFLLVCAGG
jgi:hypothetical protein